MAKETCLTAAFYALIGVECTKRDNLRQDIIVFLLVGCKTFSGDSTLHQYHQAGAVSDVP